jgi:methyl-accepting chemotaxis protein
MDDTINRSAARGRSLPIEQIDVALCVLGLDGRVTDWNQALVDLTGFAEENARGLLLGEALTGEKGPPIPCNGFPWTVLDRRTDVLRPVRVTARLLPEQQGVVVTLSEAARSDDALVALVDEMAAVSKAHEGGWGSAQVDPARHQGPCRKIAELFNRSQQVHRRVIARVMEVVAAYADGDFKAVLEPFAGDHAVISEKMGLMREAISGIQRELSWLMMAARDGRLSERSSASYFKGAWADILADVNGMLDATLQPIAEETRILTKIARGDLRERVEIACGGDHAKVKAAVNALHGWLNDLIHFVERIASGDLNATIAKASDDDQVHGHLVLLCSSIRALVDDTSALSSAAVSGNLAARADPARHQGDFRRVIEGVNATFDAVIGPLRLAAGYVDRIARGEIPPKITETYAGEFRTLIDNLNGCVDNVNALVADAEMLVQAAVDGDLSTRADVNRHAGQFRQVIVGVNSTLDTVIAHFNEAAGYIERISKGDIPPPILEPYRGDFNIVKDHLNVLISSLTEITAVSQRMADGDLALEVTPRSKADQLLLAFEQMVANLNAILREVTTLTERVAVTADEVAKASLSVSDGAGKQASTLVEVSSAMTELAAQTGSNAESASRAHKLAAGARNSAKHGNDQMGGMTGAMREIEESSRKISKIIKVIDDIAFQTNLLALNAAVEAARAGQHGKGFAVVADEVRNLAVRSAKAAAQTTEMIESSMIAVERGAKIALKTAEALGAITAEIDQMTRLIADIAQASAEQARAIQETTSALGQIELVTQRTSEKAGASASSSQNLLKHARGLQETISRLRLREEPAVTSLPDWVTPELLVTLRAMLGQEAASIPALPAPNRPAGLPPKVARGLLDF